LKLNNLTNISANVGLYEHTFHLQFFINNKKLFKIVEELNKLSGSCIALSLETVFV